MSTELSIAAKKSFITKHENILTRTEHIMIADELENNGQLHLIKDSSDGSIINLNMVKDESIDKIYSIVQMLTKSCPS